MTAPLCTLGWPLRDGDPPDLHVCRGGNLPDAPAVCVVALPARSRVIGGKRLEYAAQEWYCCAAHLAVADFSPNSYGPGVAWEKRPLPAPEVTP